MSEQAIAALKAGREEVLAVARSLTPEEWEQPSDCAGWRVQDVINHMSNVFRNFVDPGSNPPAIPGKTEATQDAAVDACRDWPAEKVLADYEAMSEQGLVALEGLATGPMADSVVPLDDLGKHPLRLLVNALTFDHFCHLRNDILQPNGPIHRDVDEVDDARIGVVTEWLISGLPQMSPPALAAAVDRPVLFELTGGGGGAWSLRPAQGEEIGVVIGAQGDEAATITSSATDFVIWGTHRRPWRECDVAISGDEKLGAAVLDAIHVF